MRKIIFCLIITACTIVSAQAQFYNYVRIGVDAGIVASSDRDEKFGLGGTVSWLTADNYIFNNSTNYISISVKGFNNPYAGGKFISSIMNEVNDGFNYIMPLVGYRFTKTGMDEGFFVEPRVGIVFGSNYTTFALSPLAGYAFGGFDASLFIDLALGGKNNASLSKNIFTPGLSIAYNFKL